jgi:DNA-binding CsgD family transcriptional regulator
MGLVRGVKLASKRAFVQEHLGENAWEGVLRRLPEEDCARLGALDSAAWYEEAGDARLLQAARTGLGLDESRLLALGRTEVERELSAGTRCFLRLVRPSYALHNLDLYWRRTHDTGQWRTCQRSGELVAELHGWERVDRAACVTVLGGLGRLLELLGARVGALEHPRCRAEGHPVCVFQTRLELHETSRRRAGALSRQDLGAVARELLQCAEREVLTEAVLELLHGQLGCGWAGLWAGTGSGGWQLLGTQGERGSRATRCFLLEASSRVVGRLEVEPVEGHGVRGVEELLGELVPWVAMALERAERAERAEPGASPQRSAEGGLPHRLQRAGQVWHLTPRQLEVLELLTRGRTNKEIATELGRSEGTVELHVTHLLRKCGASHRSELAARFWSEL